MLSTSLKEIQEKLDKNPNNDDLKQSSSATLMKYMEAITYEEKLLCQQAKVDWLKEGDRNSAFS